MATTWRPFPPGMIRLERYFRGRPYDEELFEHVMDNLYALEDPEVVDDRTVIGTL